VPSDPIRRSEWPRRSRLTGDVTARGRRPQHERTRGDLTRLCRRRNWSRPVAANRRNTPIAGDRESASNFLEVLVEERQSIALLPRIRVEAPRTVRLEVNVGLGHEARVEDRHRTSRANADGVAVREQLLGARSQRGACPRAAWRTPASEAAERELSELQGEEAGIGNRVAIERAVLPSR